MSPTPDHTTTLVDRSFGIQSAANWLGPCPEAPNTPCGGMAWRSPVPEGLEARTLRGDLMDPDWVDRAVARIRPDRVFHLAGQSRESLSWQDPWRTYHINLRSQLNLLQALARHAPGLPGAPGFDQCRLRLHARAIHCRGSPCPARVAVRGQQGCGGDDGPADVPGRRPEPVGGAFLQRDWSGSEFGLCPQFLCPSNRGHRGGTAAVGGGDRDPGGPTGLPGCSRHGPRPLVA